MQHFGSIFFILLTIILSPGLEICTCIVTSKLFFLLVLTILLFIALFFAGMDWFDSLNHAFTTISMLGLAQKTTVLLFLIATFEGIMIFFMLFSSKTIHSTTMCLLENL